MNTGERIYVQELTEKIQQLESERQEMIDALKQGRSCMVEAYNYDSTLVDEGAINSVETALRNAGVTEES